MISLCTFKEVCRTTTAEGASCRDCTNARGDLAASVKSAQLNGKITMFVLEV